MAPDMPPVSVYLVDDHPLVLETLSSVIARRPGMECIGASTDGRHAIEQIAQLRPSVVVLDMRMPGLDGERVLRELSDRRLPVLVLALSGDVDGEAARRALTLGASGYLSKHAGADEVGDAILAVARGVTVLPDQLQPELDQSRPGRPRGPALTRRELEILAQLAEGRSAPRIAESLQLSPATVRGHLQTLYGKLGVSTQAGAVAAAMRLGLLR